MGTIFEENRTHCFIGGKYNESYYQNVLPAFGIANSTEEKITMAHFITKMLWSQNSSKLKPFDEFLTNLIHCEW